MLRDGETSSRIAMALAALALLAACGGEPTRIVVVVDTDLPLASVHARTGDPGCTACEHDFALRGPDGGAGTVEAPFSFVIEPRGDDASREVRLRVEGRDGAGIAIVTRTVRTRFLSGRTLLLHVLLEDACRDASCVGDTTTCVAGTCVDDSVDPASLPDVEPGRELARDGGAPRDGGDLADGGDLVDGGDLADGGDAGEGRDGGGSALPRACGPTDSGAITIDPDGAGPGAAFEVICDRSDGLSWVLIANVAAGSTILGYDAEAWTGTEDLASPTPGVGPTDQGLFLPYWRTPVDRLRIVMIDFASTTRTRIVSLSETTTVRAAMEAPASVRLDGTASDWAALVGAGGDLGTCALAGIGVGMVRARVRIGALIPDDDRCVAGSSAVAFFGVAAQVDGVGGCDPPPPNHTGGATFCISPRTSRMAYAAQALVYGHATGG